MSETPRVIAGMRMPVRDRRPLGKCAIAVVLIGAHALIIELLSRGSPRGTIPGKVGEARMILYFFEPPPELKAPERERAALAPSYSPPLAEVSQDAAITVAPELAIQPEVDWVAEAEREGRDWAKRQDAEGADRPFGSHPKGMGPLPPGHSAPRRGDVHRFEGGEMIEWINDHCYLSNQPVPGQLGPPRVPVTVCKPGGGASGFQDFEIWRQSRGAPRQPDELP